MHSWQPVSGTKIPFFGSMPSERELSEMLGDTAAGKEPEWAMDIDRHPRGAANMLDC